jgi:hypothetical protein
MHFGFIGGVVLKFKGCGHFRVRRATCQYNRTVIRTVELYLYSLRVDCSVLGSVLGVPTASQYVH